MDSEGYCPMTQSENYILAGNMGGIVKLRPARFNFF